MSISEAYIAQRFKVDPAIAKAASDPIIAHVGPAPAPVDDPDPPEMQQAPAPPQMQESESPADYSQRSAKYVTECMCIHENNRTRSRAYEQDKVAFKAFKVNEIQYQTDVEELLPQFVAEAVAKAKAVETQTRGNKRNAPEDERNDDERGKKKKVEGISRPHPCKACYEARRVCRDMVGPRLAACLWCREKKIKCEDPDPDPVVLKQLVDQLKDIRVALEAIKHELATHNERMTVHTETLREDRPCLEMVAETLPRIVLALENQMQGVHFENSNAGRKEKGKRRVA